MAATDKALAGLRQMIASGELGPGAKFPPEPELCDHLGVSRSSLREAARSLAALGVIESRHGSGTYVSALDPAEIISRFSLSVELIPLEGVLATARGTPGARGARDRRGRRPAGSRTWRRGWATSSTAWRRPPTRPRSSTWTPSSTARSVRPAGTRPSPR